MGKRLSVNVFLEQSPQMLRTSWEKTSTPAFSVDSIKRSIDLVISILFLLTLGWILLPLIALAIRLNSKGPILFKQQRNGFKGSTFSCLKFRTMYYPCKEVFEQAKKNDSRITSIGKLLRKTSLDELPQIFNVIKGDMSLVGPRPHPLPLDEEYSNKLKAYNQRYDSKPGLTGLAQIKGFRGETATDYDMKNRLRMDLVYVKHKNIFLDLLIIFKSFLLIFKGGPNAF